MNIFKAIIKSAQIITMVCIVITGVTFVSQHVSAVGLKDQACEAAGTADISNWRELSRIASAMALGRPYFGAMKSAARPFMCALCSEPPTRLFTAGLR